MGWSRSCHLPTNHHDRHRMASDWTSTLVTADTRSESSKAAIHSQTTTVTAAFVEPSTTISQSFPANKQVKTTVRALSGKLVERLNDVYNLELSGRKDIQYHGSYPLTVDENATMELGELGTRHLELLFRPHVETSPSKSIYARSQSKDKHIVSLEERRGKDLDRFEQLEERLKTLERKLERQGRKYEKQKKESRGELEKQKRESRGELEKYKRESRREFQELKDIVLPLHVRSILDQCRKRVMERMQFTTGRWETFRGARNEDELVSYITQAVHLSSSAAHLLCGKYGRYPGDFAAHSCSENQARRAVLAKENAHFQGDLGELFTFVYGSAV